MPTEPEDGVDDVYFHEIAVRTAEIAEATPGVKRCIEGEAMFFHKDVQARVPGHIYSELGKDEAKISGACEYHFDLWFSHNEEDN